MINIYFDHHNKEFENEQQAAHFIRAEIIRLLPRLIKCDEQGELWASVDVILYKQP